MESEFRRKVLFVVKILFFTLGGVLLVFYFPEVFLLIFAGMLFAIFLRSLSEKLSHWTGLSSGWSLGIVILCLVVVLFSTGYLAAPSISQQFDVLVKELPASIDKLRNQIEGYAWGQILLDKAAPENILEKSRTVVRGVGGAFSSLLGWIANFVIILFIGLYGAIEPGVYRTGFLHLIPKANRERVAEVVLEINDTLKWWLIGKFFGMAVIGIFTTFGLSMLDVPLAFILGIIAALFTFIPNIGPILAAVPAVLLGLMASPEQALYVALLYIGIQIVESYLLTPLVQRKTIDLPPALTLAAQVLLGVSLGGLGVALATPLTAVALVATKRLYVEDGLSDKDPQPVKAT